MGLAKRGAQTIGVGGNHDQMYMVGHQAIAPDFGSRALATFRQQVYVQAVVIIGEKGFKPSVAALGDMVRDTGDNGACYSGHGGKVSIGGARRNN